MTEEHIDLNHDDVMDAAYEMYEALEAFLGLNRWQAPRTGGALPTDDEIDEVVAISLGMEAINKARGGVQ